MGGDSDMGPAEPIHKSPFNFQTQVLSTSPVKSVSLLVSDRASRPLAAVHAPLTARARHAERRSAPRSQV